MVRSGRQGRRVGLALVAFLVACGTAYAQMQVETITPEDSDRPLTFQDWCVGIKNLGDQRCAQMLPEDQKAFHAAKRHLRTMNFGPKQTMGCNANTSVNPNSGWGGNRNCQPADQPLPALQPFSGPR